MSFIGEVCSISLIKKLHSCLPSKTHLWNTYGPAETTVSCTYYRVDMGHMKDSVPIGRPLPNYKCMILDDYFQCVTIGEEGELFVGGVGVFAGYLGREDLTMKALIEINGETFYRTGDLVRMDNNGLIHYIGRKDHQIKLHGQRIELGEIERCLLNTSISACVVIKWGDDHLVAYVQCSDIKEKQLREHCQAHLPPHMIPSMFIVLKQLPLNTNGKVDRKLLPSPELCQFVSNSESVLNRPQNTLEKRVHDIWCELLPSNGKPISITMSFFSIGGHSLLFIQLYHRYQSLFDFDSRQLSIGLFLRQPTIHQHAQLLQTIKTNDNKSTPWNKIHINEGKLSCFS